MPDTDVANALVEIADTDCILLIPNLLMAYIFYFVVSHVLPISIIAPNAELKGRRKRRIQCGAHPD